MKKTNKKAYEFGKNAKKANFNHDMWGIMDAFVITSKNENDQMNKFFTTDRFVTGEGSMRSNDPTGHSAWIVDTRIKLDDTYLKNTDWMPFMQLLALMYQMTEGCASVGNVLRPFETFCKTHNLPNGYFKRAVQLIVYMILENVEIDWSKQDNFVFNVEQMDHAIDLDRAAFWTHVADKLNQWSGVYNKN